MDNQGSAANWTQCVAFYKKFCVPLPLFQPIDKTIEFRSIGHFFLEICSSPKDAKYYIDSKSKGEEEEKNA